MTLSDISALKGIAINAEMVAIDLDGTILDMTPAVTPRVEHALRAAAEKTKLVIVTGRTYRSTLPWARRFNVSEPLVCYQGALIRAVDESAGTLREIALDGEIAARAVETARANNWHRQIYRDDKLLCEEDRPEAHIYAQIAGIDIEFVPDLLDCLQHGTTKLVCVITDPLQVSRCIGVMKDEFGGAAYVTRSRPEFVEVLNPSVSKGEALRWLAGHLGVSPRNVVAIGDAPNDIPMFEVAGLSVATASADESVFPYADCTCAPPELGGVADVLVRLGLV